ncbi:cysteine-rich receptor-like protein kinase, partial [Trifolium medium]|nr:cysteine-rich receptor-like protein kinase [Trifolium medium]
MWYRVLENRYDEEAGWLAGGGRSGSVWWREISKIRDGVSDVGGGWFGESIERRVGNGVDSFFWTDPWLGGAPLSVQYRR